LRALAVRGSLYTFAGFGFSQVFRLASNLILTRLLVPEVFGIMALVNVFITGLQMFSDVGIGPAIIQNKRDDRAFLNTAWTIQAGRGILLGLGSLALAWPVARFYGQPELAVYLPVAALTAVISGFNSTVLFTLNREMAIGKLTVLNMGTQVVSTAVTILLAWVYPWFMLAAFHWDILPMPMDGGAIDTVGLLAALRPSVWVLLIGVVLGSLLRMVVSHILFPSVRNWFHWDRAAARSLFNFGKWIFFSTAITFLAGQGDRMLLGRIFDITMLGVYSIAFFLSDSLARLVSTIATTVFYPAYSRVFRDRPEGLPAVYLKSTLTLSVLVLPGAGFLLLAGDWVIHFLYPDAYEAAGWMLQVLAIRVALSGMFPPAGKVLLAIGRPQWSFWSDVAGTICLLAAIPIGYHYYGVAGAVWGISLSEFAKMPVLWTGLMRFHLFSAWKEAVALALVALGAALGYFFTLYVPYVAMGDLL
jgi:O-antigen/teichoic acid export membrane protein